MADIGISAQRKRRDQRMANRCQRLALGPVSDHGDEIAQALEIFKAKQDAQVCGSGEIKAQQQIDSSAIAAFIPKQSCTPEISAPLNKSVDEVVIQMLQPKVTCQTLKLDDLLTFDMGWTVKSINTLREIGRGSYGRILLARHRSTGVSLAIKEPSWSDDFASPGEMVEEIKATRTRATKEAMVHQLVSGSPYFPKFWGTLDLGNNRLCQAVAFVGCKKTGAGYPLLSSPSLSTSNILKIAEDIVRGMMEFHNHGLLHNDLKSDNVLLEKGDKRYNAIIIDFGMASSITAPPKMIGVNPQLKMAYLHGIEADYIAPEVVLDEQPTSIASDVFSVGRIFSDIGQTFGDLRSPAVQELSNLGSQCMAENPEHRPDLNTALDRITELESTSSKTKRPGRWRRVLRWVAKKLRIRRS